MYSMTRWAGKASAESQLSLPPGVKTSKPSRQMNPCLRCIMRCKSASPFSFGRKDEADNYRILHE